VPLRWILEIYGRGGRMVRRMGGEARDIALRETKSLLGWSEILTDDKA